MFFSPGTPTLTAAEVGGTLGKNVFLLLDDGGLLGPDLSIKSPGRHPWFEKRCFCVCMPKGHGFVRHEKPFRFAQNESGSEVLRSRSDEVKKKKHAHARPPSHVLRRVVVSDEIEYEVLV